MLIKSVTILFVILLCPTIFCKRILSVFPVPSKSHQNVYDNLMLELVNRGHEVVMITVYPMLDPPKNLTQLDVSFSEVELKKRLKYVDFQSKKIVAFHQTYIYEFIEIFKMQLETPGVKNILENKEEKFDLLFLSFISLSYAFVHRFPEVPVICFSTLSTDYVYFGAPIHPIVYPELFRVKLYDLTLWDKVESVFDLWHFRFVDWLHDIHATAALREYFGEDMPSLLELKTKTDLIFMNRNVFITGVRPVVPAIIQTDRLHLRDKKPLTKDLQEYLDNSPNGVVYMSLGSNVLSKDLSNKTLEILNKAFSEVPYNILWKFEADSLPGLPDNIMIRKWLPQQDLLDHKNVKLFIFQGGQQSFEEAIRDSVPLICFPVAVDQHINAQRITKLELGVRMNFATLTVNNLKEAIFEVITNPKYKSNMSNLSHLIADEPETSMDRAVWWTEYLLRHKTAKHLRSPSADATYVEFFMLDVIAVILISAVSLLLAIFLLLRYLLRCVFCKLNRKFKIN